jgi:DNA-binding NarL/FixJ family response regulator
MLSMHDKAVCEPGDTSRCSRVRAEGCTSRRYYQRNRNRKGWRVYFSSGLKQNNTNNVTQILTQREQCVLNSITTGKSNKHIALDLGLSVRTVETHRLNIKRKLNIEGQADLIRYALSNINQ